MSKLYRIAFGLFLLLSLFVFCTKETPTQNSNGSNSGTSSLAGKVVQKSGLAKIYLEQGRPVDSVVTDPADGYFALDHLKPGTYLLKIVSPGYDTFSTMITVAPDYSYEFGIIVLAPKTKKTDDSIPSTYDYYPQNNAELLYLPPDKYSQGSDRLYISVSFDRPMDRESVEKALSIEPKIDGGYFVWYQNMRTFTYDAQPSTVAWNGAVMYDKVSVLSTSAAAYDTVATIEHVTPSGDISTYSVAKSFTFYFPKSSCFTDTTYTVKISRSALDTSGTPLDTALEFKFKTVQSAVAIEGIEINPPDGDDWVPLLNNGITVTFPKRMDEASTESGITINLMQEPIFLWSDYNHLTLYTGGMFVPDTTYGITFATSIKDLDGKPILDSAKTMRFRTAPICITQTTPVRGSVGVRVSDPIVLTYNTNMDRSSFADVGTLVSSKGDTVSGKFNYVYYYYSYPSTDTTFTLNQIQFIPYSKLSHNTLYTFYLKPGAKDLNGYAMKDDYKIQFVTMP